MHSIPAIHLFCLLKKLLPENHPKKECVCHGLPQHYAVIRRSPFFSRWGSGIGSEERVIKGFSLGAVTATLLAAIAIGQLGITISPNVKSVFFLMFLFAVGYGVGPQFVRGIAKDGLPQALFSVVQCVLCLAAPFVAAKLAGYDIGSAAGLFAGSQTISASMGLATDAINRLGLPARPDESAARRDADRLRGHRTSSARSARPSSSRRSGRSCCASTWSLRARNTRRRSAGRKELGGAGQAWHEYELRAYRIPEGGPVVGRTVGQVEALPARTERGFSSSGSGAAARCRRRTLDDVLQAGDVVAVRAGRREQLECDDSLGSARRARKSTIRNCWRYRPKAWMSM